MQEIITHIQKAVLQISKALKSPDTSHTQNKNSSGDVQLGFDILSDAIITQSLSQCPSIKALISEEKDAALACNDGAKFILAYDPLDGSSLLDVNFAIGSIFAIYENEARAKNLKAALYSIYGARLELVVCTGERPRLYRLDDAENFIFVRELALSQRGKINAPGGTQKFWSAKHQALIKSLFDEGYRLRYSGAMVSDIHQILLKGGGLFSYPATKDAPQGKLRALFEVLPLALIVEKAGGKTSDGLSDSLLGLEFSQPHATTPCFFGSEYEITKLLRVYND